MDRSTDNIIELMEIGSCPKEEAEIRIRNRRLPQPLTQDTLALYSLIIVMAVLAICAFAVAAVVIVMLL